MNCKKCGNSISRDSKFCAGCGEKIEIPVLEEQSVKFCGECGSEINQKAKFCAKCGAKQSGDKQRIEKQSKQFVSDGIKEKAQKAIDDAKDIKTTSKTTKKKYLLVIPVIIVVFLITIFMGDSENYSNVEKSNNVTGMRFNVTIDDFAEILTENVKLNEDTENDSANSVNSIVNDFDASSVYLHSENDEGNYTYTFKEYPQNALRSDKVLQVYIDVEKDSNKIYRLQLIVTPEFWDSSTKVVGEQMGTTFGSLKPTSASEFMDNIDKMLREDHYTDNVLFNAFTSQDGNHVFTVTACDKEYYKTNFE